MKLEELLQENREEILEGWRKVLLESYPSETTRFLSRENDQFANPVGHFIKVGTESILDQLLGPMHQDSICETIDPIIRIRAVQDFDPGPALQFVFALKHVVRDVTGSRLREENLVWELSDLDARIDRVGLIAFETYTRCRDQLQEMKVESIKRRYAVLLKRMNMLDVDPDPQDTLQEGEA